MAKIGLLDYVPANDFSLAPGWIPFRFRVKYNASLIAYVVVEFWTYIPGYSPDHIMLVIESGDLRCV